MYAKLPVLLTAFALLVITTGFTGNDPEPEAPTPPVSTSQTCISVPLYPATLSTTASTMDVKQDIGTVFGGTVCFSSCSDFPCCFIIDEPEDPGDDSSDDRSDELRSA